MCQRRGCRRERETQCYMQRDRWSVCSSSDERRRTGTSGKEEGGIDRHLPSETKKMEGKNSSPSLCDTNTSPPILWLELWCPGGTLMSEDSFVPEFQTPLPVIPESFSLCNPLVPGVLLILESYWFRNTFGFQNPHGSVMRGYNPIPKKRSGVGMWGDDAHTNTHAFTHTNTCANPNMQM